MKILDCTLRDGGYYNNWNFDPVKAIKLIKSLNRAGVDIVELGYKTPIHFKGFYGLFKYCPETYLNNLSKDDSSDYAFMLDVKQWVFDNNIDIDGLNKVVKDSEDSIFSWVRLASHFNTINYIPDLVSYFHSKGYKVGFNLMGGSLLSEDQIKAGAEIAELSDVDVFYVADSFGSFYPKDIRKLIKLVKEPYTGAIGIHTHDNQGMAYANTLTAMEEGVEFVDGTLTGMGRGAGNLHTEQLLLGLQEKKERYNANALVNIIDEYIQPLKDKHKWGYSPTYMYSGLKNIHPTYCQNLIASDRFTSNEINSILELIPKESRAKYDTEILSQAIETNLDSEKDVDANKSDMPTFDINRISTKGVVILARGPSVKPHIKNIVKWANKNAFTLIECNHTDLLTKYTKRFTAILNRVRLKRWVREQRGVENQLISGYPIMKYRDGDGVFPFSIGNFGVEESRVTLPDYDAGLYAMGLALNSQATRIFLAGFDGFKDENKNINFASHLKEVKNTADKKGAAIVHITPSHYTIFEQESLYSLSF